MRWEGQELDVEIDALPGLARLSTQSQTFASAPPELRLNTPITPLR